MPASGLSVPDFQGRQCYEVNDLERSLFHQISLFTKLIDGDLSSTLVLHHLWWCPKQQYRRICIAFLVTSSVRACIPKASTSELESQNNREAPPCPTSAPKRQQLRRHPKSQEEQNSSSCPCENASIKCKYNRQKTTALRGKKMNSFRNNELKQTPEYSVRIVEEKIRSFRLEIELLACPPLPSQNQQLNLQETARNEDRYVIPQPNVIQERRQKQRVNQSATSHGPNCNKQAQQRRGSEC